MDTMACTHQTSLTPSGMGLVDHQHGDLPHTGLYARPTEPMTPDLYHGLHLLTQYPKLRWIVPKLQTSQLCHQILTDFLHLLKNHGNTPECKGFIFH